MDFLKKSFLKAYTHIASLFIGLFVKQKVQSTKRKVKKYKKGRKKTIKQTLNNLDDNFEVLRRATIKRSWTCKKEINGLKKIGAFVPYDEMMFSNAQLSGKSDCVINYKKHKKYPAQMFVSTKYQCGEKDEYDEYSAFPHFLYAIKNQELPWNVEPTKDVIYNVGVCMPVQKTKEHEIKNFWTNFYVAIDKKGRVRRLKQILEKQEYIPSIIKRSKSLWYQKISRRGFQSTRKFWDYAEVLPPSKNFSKEQNHYFHQVLFVACYDFWMERDKMWTVQVRKDDLRMSFCVDARDTKHYFQDREYATNHNGNRKKIIHFVEEHERTTEKGTSIVREHIRGERQFLWNGYHCNVKAPKFKNVFSMPDFDVGAIVLEKDDPRLKSDQYSDLNQVADKLTPMLDEKQQNIYESA